MKNHITQEEFDKMFERDEKSCYTNLIIPAFKEFPEMNLIGKLPKDYTQDEIIRSKTYKQEMRNKIRTKKDEDIKTISDKYINGLENKYIDTNYELSQEFHGFIERKKEITEEELNALLKEFPDTPKSLIELLKYSNGTNIYFFQSDVDDGKYPYYLVNSNKILEYKDIAKQFYGDYIDRPLEDEEIDERITNDSNKAKWMLFSNCMNNGGTSQLFIDFTPSSKGKVGQIVRFLHDPDSIVVIADSFDEFLQKIIDSNYKFVDAELETRKMLKSNSYTKPNTSRKKRISLKFILLMLFGIMCIPMGILAIVYSYILYGIISLLFGILCIYVSISESK